MSGSPEDKAPVNTAVLVKIYGENLNTKYQLNGPVVNIGRHPKSEIKVDSINVSRTHCVLKCEKGDWILKDNNSQNGTFINGKYLERKQEYKLQCGDIFFLGPPSQNPEAFSFDNFPEEVDHVWTTPIKEVSSSNSSTQSCDEYRPVQFSKGPQILEIKKSKEILNKITNSISISSKNNDAPDEIDLVDSFEKRVQDRMAKKSAKNSENEVLCIPSTSQGLSKKGMPFSGNLNASCSSASQSHQSIKGTDYVSSSCRNSNQSCDESHVQSSKNPGILEVKKSKGNKKKMNSSTSISSRKNGAPDETDIVDSSVKRASNRIAKKSSKNLNNKELGITSTSQELCTQSMPLSRNLNAGCSSVPQSHQVENDSPSLLIVEEDGLFGDDSYPFSQVLGESESAAPNNHIDLNKMETEASNNLKDNDNNELKSKLALLSEEIKHLENSKSSLLKEYVDVCEKNKRLDQQLAEQQKLKDDMLMCEMRVKNKFKSQIMEKLEEELICNICTEVLIQPTVLDCSHTFCEHCILEWKKQKGQCPICRNQIKSMTRILALDHFIDKTLETLTPGQKEKRKELILERERSKNPPPKTTTPRGSRRRGRARRYSNRRPVRTAQIIQSVPVQQPISVHIPQQPISVRRIPEVVELDTIFNQGLTSRMDVFLSDSDNDSSIEMMDHYIEPCYNCGRYGHMHYECMR